jgi:predicted  nucleic acid-binding Zn-ribbon protein
MKASLTSLHHQSADWQRELGFYKDELAILAKRLEEVTQKNNSKETLATVEHFQNKFIMLHEQLDVLKHDIGIREKEIEALATDRPEHISEKFSSVHDSVQERMKDFSAGMADTRFEFNKFLAQVL